MKDRDYVTVDKNRFTPNESGRLVTAFLERFFERYVSYDYTAGLEEGLDDHQPEPQGYGHAVWCARELIGDEPFAVMLPDMVMSAEPPALRQAVTAFHDLGGNIVVVEPAPEGDTDKYGIVSLGERSGRTAPMIGMVEKPPLGTEPSNLFISGRYILQPQIFDHLGRHRAGAGGEIQLTDAMLGLMETQPFHALEYEGTTFDCGDPVGLLRANVAFALKHKSLGAAARTEVEAVLRAQP